MTTPANKHTWKFYRIGGLDQVALETGEDLLHLHELDPKLWVALSCPVKGLELDEKTLALIDTDQDGRIRVAELLAAIKWAALHLKDPGDLLKGKPEIELSAINDATPEGKAVLVSARQILGALGKGSANSISLDHATGRADIFAATKFNGDGVLPVGSASDPAIAGVLGEIIAAVGAEPDRSGLPGVNAAKNEAFFAQLSDFIAWSEKAAAPEIATLGGATAAAAAAVQAIRAKVDDYFSRCRLAAFDPRAATALNRSENDFAAISGKDLSATATECLAFPLARIEAGAALPLKGALNPAWAKAIEALRRDAVTVLFGEGKSSLSEDEWLTLQDKTAAFIAWQAAKPATGVEKLGIPRAKDLLASKAKEAIATLIAQDLAVAGDFEAIAAVERLLRYHRDLRALLHNFVNFFDFYSYDRQAVFQAGTLYLDSRSCELCIRVDNPGAHSALAAMSKAYIAYVDCKRPGATPMTIAACFTQGDSDYLFVGRNGVFYDRAGKDWDASISKVVDNPISIGQAFWSPYKRVLRFVEEQVAKRAASADAESTEQLQTGTLATGSAAVTGKPAAAPKPKFDVGTVAALGVAVGGITAALGAVLQAFFGLGIWMPLGLLGLMLLISGPAMVIAWLKLRQRNLGPLLEANGWAINGRVKINIPFGTALTDKATLPASAKRSLTDPYEDESGKKARRWTYAILVIVLCALLAIAHHWHTWPFSAP